VTDAQWAVIEPLLPRTAPALGGRPPVYSRRLIVDMISYVLVTWDRVHEVLRERVRTADRRDPQPSAAVLDSQSAKSREGGEAIGYDAGKAGPRV
jgi:transposase